MVVSYSFHSVKPDGQCTSPNLRLQTIVLKVCRDRPVHIYATSQALTFLWRRRLKNPQCSRGVIRAALLHCGAGSTLGLKMGGMTGPVSKGLWRSWDVLVGMGCEAWVANLVPRWHCFLLPWTDGSWPVQRSPPPLARGDGTLGLLYKKY